MTYPPQLPAVLFSAFNSVERSPGPRRRRTSGKQTPHAGHRLTNPETNKLRRLRGRAIALTVVIVALGLVLGLMLGDAEEGTRGSLGLQPGRAAVPFAVM